MFSDYIAQVINFYNQKKTEGSISLNLQHPTPAKLKRECLIVFEIRRAKADLEILKQYFGNQEDEEAYELAIRKADTDRFKPLTKFLRGEIRSTEDKNIILLSWLIDFSPRPYRPGYQSENRDNNIEKAAQGKELSINLEDVRVMEKFEVLKPLEDPASTTGMGTYRLPIPEFEKHYLHKYKKYGLVGLALLVLGAVSLSSDKILMTSVKSLFSNPQCMYWTEDHYVSVECDQKIPNVQVIALEPFKLNHFKKITRRDTLTERDINKVWYASVNKQIEFYTTEGNDPREPGRRLRPMSKYIFEKYIKPLHTNTR